MTEEKKEIHIQKILKIINEERIFTFKDIFVFYKEISRTTAYDNNIDKSDDIKEAIFLNKRRGVTSLIDKWMDSENATLQIAAFKLVCDVDERKAISQSNIDHTTKDQPILIDPFAAIRENNGIQTNM